MERLTPGEEQVMLRLWKLDKATIREIVELYDEPRPAYNTTSTIIRILERKKVVKHKAVGRGFVYTPRISKEAYRNFLMNNLLRFYFEGDKSEAKELIDAI